MDWKAKFNLIAFVFFVSMIAASAVIVVVKSEEEAMSVFSHGEMLKGECEVLSITKSVGASEEISKTSIVVEYKASFEFAGQTFEEWNTVGVSENSEAEIKEAVQAACDAKWLALKKEKPRVKIEYENFVLQQVYNVVAKVWSDKKQG